MKISWFKSKPIGYSNNKNWISNIFSTKTEHPIKSLTNLDIFHRLNQTKNFLFLRKDHSWKKNYHILLLEYSISLRPFDISILNGEIIANNTNKIDIIYYWISI